MPIHSPSFFIPVSLSDTVPAPSHPYDTTLYPPFVLEDIYIRGGMRCLPSVAVRDKIPIISCVVGMIAFTPEDGGKYWKVQSIVGTTVTWVELDLAPGSGGGNGGLEILGAVDPISINLDKKIEIDPLRILPKTKDAAGIPIAFEGQVVSLDSALIPYWRTLTGLAGIRLNYTITCPVLDAYSSPVYTFEYDMGRLIIMMLMAVDVPDVRIRCYGTSARDEMNPYHFISTAYLMQDDGVTELPDGTYDNKRKYTILCNKDDPTVPTLYWEVTYLANTDASRDSNGAVIQFRQPTIMFTYVALEP
jgi:hypothetical protein